MILPLSAFFTGGAGGVVTLSGEAVASDAIDPLNATARITVTDTGIVTKNENGVNTQVDSATDWVIPNSLSPSDYEVRFVSLVGDAPTVTGGTAENIWFALSGGVFALTLIQATVGVAACSFNLEIRKGSTGVALDSGAYSLSATVT